MEIMLAVGTLFKTVGEIRQGQSQEQQLKSASEVSAAQSSAFTASAQADLASTDAQIAVEKASAAERTVDRIRHLREITGDMLAKGVGAGVSISSGSIGTLIADTQGQFAREQGIQDFNLRNTETAIKSAGENRFSDLTSKSAALSTQSSVQRIAGSNARTAGFVAAAGTLMNFGMDHQNRGSAPKEK